MEENTLKHKAASGMVWTFIQKFAEMFVSFVSGIILARLLTPDDYGCIGMLYIFMLIAGSIVDGGFASALIQKKRPTQEDYSTIFFFNLGMSLLMYLILFLSAPAISFFYKMPLLCPVLRVQGLVVIINAFSLIHSNQLRKQFKFRKLAIVSLATSIISFSVTILMAYWGYGVWSLVTMNLLSAFIPTIVYWLTNNWFPLWVFSKESFKELFGFGFYMFLTNIISTFCNNIQGLLIGRFYNSATMGYYSKARSTEEMASTSISNVMSQVTYPLYAECQDDMPMLINVIKRITSSIAYVTFPLMLLLILLAKPVFVLLFSERWLESVPFFQILCVAGIAVCLQGVNYQAIAAVGKSKAMFAWTLVKRAAGLLLMVGGMSLFGIKGLLVGMVMQSWIIYLINAYLVHKYIGYKIYTQLYDLSPILILSAVSCAIAYLTTLLIPSCHMYVWAIIAFFVFLVSYLGGSVLFRLNGFIYVRETLPMFFSRLKKNGYGA
ncbi:MAG: lipopolysaccharide biosynthesis protein [Bacteroidales bacterium]|nr:lipopolysaccharide biosynthesis protein [Bacteroidales bacterium]